MTGTPPREPPSDEQLGTTEILPSEPLNNEQLGRAWAIEDYWRKLVNEAQATGIAKLEDAAKQLVGLTGALQGLYFAAIAFTNVREQVTGLATLLFILPALFWFCSLICATLVFVPRPRSDADLNNFSASAWQGMRDAYITATNAKRWWLRWSHVCLIISFFIILALLAYLATLPAPAAKAPTQIMIVTPTP